MRFLHIEDFFHPDAGYQINLLSKLQAKQGHEVIIVTSELDKIPSNLTSFFGKENILEKDKQFEDMTKVKIIRLPILGYYSGRAIFKLGFIKVIKSLMPDVLMIHGNDTLTGIRLLLNYNRLKLPIVMDNHMLEMATVNKHSKKFKSLYKKFITPIIIKNQIPVITVVRSNFVNKSYAIPTSLIIESSFGTDADYFSPNESTKIEMRRELNIADNDFVVLYAGKMNAEKGGQFLADALQKKITLRNEKKIVFIIIGKTSDDEYGNQVDLTFSKSENQIIRVPTQKYPDLAKYYQTADIAIFAKQCSMSYFEVQACGLPVVLEKNEINVERASENKGILFEGGDTGSFRNAMKMLGDMETDVFNQYKKSSRENILKKFNYAPIAEEFSSIMIEEYKKFSRK